MTQEFGAYMQKVVKKMEKVLIPVTLGAWEEILQKRLAMSRCHALE